jgi:hypothetical protein
MPQNLNNKFKTTLSRKGGQKFLKSKPNNRTIESQKKNQIVGSWQKLITKLINLRQNCSKKR